MVYSRKAPLRNKEQSRHIGAIINQLLSEQQRFGRLYGSQVLNRWQEVVGSQIARQAQPESLKEGVLRVRVENSVWLNHLHFLGEELRTKLNRVLPQPEIKEIRFRQGPLDPILSETPPVHYPKSPPSEEAEKALPPLSPEQQAQLAKISDDDLRGSLENLLRKQKKFSGR